MSKKVVGKNIKKVDAKDKVTGQAPYTRDINFEDMLYVKVKRATRPHAYLRKLDVSQAEQLAGVVKIITAKDYPDLNNFGLIIKDQPVLIDIGDKMRFMGDVLAIVIAKTEEIATKALELIEVEVEELEIITDPLEAMEEDVPAIHEAESELISEYLDNNISSNNILCDHYLKKGDVEEGFSQADLIVENEYKTQHIDQVPLQVEAGVGLYDEETGLIKIWAATQWLHDTQADIAQSIGLPKEKVRIIQPTIGGAFGKKEDISVHIHLALAAMEVKQPVKFSYTREESMISQSKRHPMTIRHKTGVTNEGYLTAWQTEVIGDVGAYASSSPAVVHKSLYHCTGPYNVENVKGVSYAVYTNNTYTGAMRGFGATQMGFAYDSQIDIIAEKLGMDPFEFRLQNTYQLGSTTPNGQVLTKSVNVKRTIQEVKDMSKRGDDR
ncbi:aerobic-type carbon monoxide dehydrogenase, large subunit CoxL/CutL-like protein [Halobacteroides halobius DSM 5150]|uniref:Aerobic-type carbon monoxide dehydrogenase, large subunit CoxL/CutL-like protein n=1 Tax=Halobacteroides halobius (strain ATCC 35273 / DSM 5150 / MD-1) TaxID=748449 RepID=L0K7L9_HALHC|nr:molybdopterin cofactor-binding domain-containing protein [Halobacteroides halobius]AGB41011.1 aerobic-type carbon monoxide dehydrogenase, large subunit CoxL/CutL-like protein [Halobacteroides halobius DSM 5150]